MCIKFSFHIPIIIIILRIPFHIPQGLTASDIGASSLFDYTDRVERIIDGIRDNPPNNDERCCNYTYQILDKRCASRPFVSYTITL